MRSMNEFYDSILKSKVNGVDVYVHEELLHKLFKLSNKGRKCIRLEFTRNYQGETIEIHHDDIINYPNLIKEFYTNMYADEIDE